LSKKVYIGFAGCKVNQFEKSLLQEQLAGNDCELVSSSAEADIIIYNTCCVTKKAEYGCRQAIRKFNRENPTAKIVVTGCYAERAKDELLKLPGVARVVGNADKNAIAEIIRDQLLSGYSDTLPVSKKRGKGVLDFEFKRTVKDRARALLKIQDGCDAFCSYCIVPHVRGKPVSMPEELVIKNLWNMKDEKEVILTGIHLGKWGKETGLTLEHLMRRICNECYPFRLRLSSLEPGEITEELLCIFKRMDNFCPHFHIPLQSGCDRILKLMNRRYTTAEFAATVKNVREKFPLAGIGVDVITGFPGETGDDFEKTRRFIELLDIDYMHIFRYSAREGTPAYVMKPKVSENVAKQRAVVLKDIDSIKRERFAERFTGRNVKALFDKKENNLYRAVTREYFKIYMDADPGENEFEAKIMGVHGTAKLLLVGDVD
jgi:threonylcarbamoyladenosine tRNA methylthiotransferase MtaB